MNFMIGTLSSYTRNLKLQMAWQTKKDTGNYTRKADDEELTERDRIQEQVWKEHREKDTALDSITTKLESGQPLTNDEMEYLRQKKPDLYQKAREAEIERKSYENALKNCKTKEDVERLKVTKLSKSLNTVQTVSNNPVIPLEKKLEICKQELAKVQDMERITQKFVESGAYAALDTDAERLEKIKDQREASMPEVPQEEPVREAEEKREDGREFHPVEEENTAQGEAREAPLPLDSNAPQVEAVPHDATASTAGPKADRAQDTYQKAVEQSAKQSEELAQSRWEARRGKKY